MSATQLQALPLPRWRHRPGRDAGADRAHLQPVLALVPERYDAVVPANDPALREGLRLNDHGFHWEAHEILEAVWRRAPQGGLDRIALRAVIQVANANLKQAMARPRAAMRLRAEALAELAELQRRGVAAPASFAGAVQVGVLRGRLLAPDRPVQLTDVALT
jgi:hypothetical protein